MNAGTLARFGVIGTLIVLVTIAIVPIFLPDATQARMDAAQNLVASQSAPAVNLPMIQFSSGMTKPALDDQMSRLINPNGGVFFNVNGKTLSAKLVKIAGSNKPPNNCSWEWEFRRPINSRWETETVRVAACMVFEFLEWVGNGNTPNGRWVP